MVVRCTPPGTAFVCAGLKAPGDAAPNMKRKKFGMTFCSPMISPYASRTSPAGTARANTESGSWNTSGTPLSEMKLGAATT